VVDNEVRPPEPLFLPIAEFETDLLDKPFPPFPPEEIAAQQEQQDFESGWVRPIVLTAVNLSQSRPGAAAASAVPADRRVRTRPAGQAFPPFSPKNCRAAEATRLR
jgi:hypothetical protein